jgi:hypothetical protein
MPSVRIICLKKYYGKTTTMYRRHKFSGLEPAEWELTPKQFQALSIILDSLVGLSEGNYGNYSFK